MIKYIQDLYFKPMRKRSRSSGEITESGRWWNCCMERMIEWTFEGSLKAVWQVWFVGNRTRYQSGVYVST